MIRLTALPPVLFALLLSVAASGCAADTEGGAAPADDTAGAEDDLTARQLPGTIAVEIADVRNRDTVLASKTIGAPKKVKSVLGAVKKLKPTDPVPRCMERDTKRLTFLDAANKPLATVDTYCAGFGHLTFANGRDGYGVKFSTEIVDGAAAAPFAVGDALYGVTSIEIIKPGTTQKRTLTGDAVKPILDGFDLDAVPNPNASFPRCLPSHAVTFMRANAKVATTSFLCGSADAANAPASVQGSFVGLDPKNPEAMLGRGGVQLDPRPVLRAFASGSN
ncbi:MAG: hypothetical protein JST00_14715 [Deltaproteobacteria bacterium]|nr:hypothetical protein [Deltaproteobacteria bacterium]